MGELVREIEALFEEADAEVRAAYDETEQRGDIPTARAAAALEEEVDALRNAVLVLARAIERLEGSG